MKALLLNKGRYIGLADLEFPVEVECKKDSMSNKVVTISGTELKRITGSVGWCCAYDYPFIKDTEIKLIS